LGLKGEFDYSARPIYIALQKDRLKPVRGKAGTPKGDRVAIHLGSDDYIGRIGRQKIDNNHQA
jgi:hypothetical protein